jgi:hypothetical protein
MPSKFEYNLEEVRRVDAALVELFLKKGNNACLNPARHYEGLTKGDLIVNGQFVEVKTDFESLYTENICIEQKSLDRNTPYFAYVLPEVYLISLPKLKILSRMGREVTGGDYNYRLSLIPKETFIKESKHYNL